MFPCLTLFNKLMIESDVLNRETSKTFWESKPEEVKNTVLNKKLLQFMSSSGKYFKYSKANLL